ncbi:MAG: type II secretion system protein GspN [Nitrospirota bacterium]|nr:type II secretion system protein GspN [Nitrospirota bacterium]
MAQGKAMKVVAVSAYVVYGVLVFAIALMVTFPVQEVAGRVAMLAADRTGWQFKVDGVRWVPPAELRVANLEASPPKGDPLRLADARLEFSPMRLREGVIAVRHDMSLYGGRLSGYMDVEGRGRDAGYTWEGFVREMDLSQVPLSAPGKAPAKWADGLLVTGKGSAEGAAAWRGEEWMRGVGRATLTANGLNLTGLKTQLGAMDLPLGDIEGKISWQRRSLDVESLVVKGDILSGEGAGRITMGSSPLTTRLDLRIQATLGDKFPMREIALGMAGAREGDPITIAVRGSLATPAVYMNGKPMNMMQGR